MLQSEPIISRVNPVSVPARRLYFALAQEDPARFGEKFGLGENKKLFTTATGYLARRGYESGWDMLEGTTQGLDAGDASRGHCVSRGRSRYLVAACRCRA